MKNKRDTLPQVLLLGNGLNLSYTSYSISWENLIRDGGDSLVPFNLRIPFSLEVVLRTSGHVREKMENQKEMLFGRVDTEILADTITKMFNIGFDEVLTTNYSYELESAVLKTQQVTEKQLNDIRNSTTGTADKKFLLHTYNEVSSDLVPYSRIWHIHGEAANPDSMVISHEDYGSLLNRFVNFIRWREKDNRFSCYWDIPMESWIDAFMLGDVYILGQGLDFAEMDLWWLIERKHNLPQNHGSIYFYEPKSDRSYDAKTELLKIYGANYIDLNYALPVKPGHGGSAADNEKYQKEKDAVYSRFYLSALEDIAGKVKSRR